VGFIALLGIAGVAGAAFLAEHGRLKRKRHLARPAPWPSLEALDRVSALSLAVGFPLLTLGVVTGAGDLERANPNHRTVIDPYSGDSVVVVPALNPDVAIVHVQRADREGNAHIWGIIGEQKEAAWQPHHLCATSRRT